MWGGFASGAPARSRILAQRPVANRPQDAILPHSDPHEPLYKLHIARKKIELRERLSFGPQDLREIQIDQLAAELRHDPEGLGVYLVYDQGVPAGSAWMRSARGGPFAGLWGGSILPEHRRRGLYASLLAARAQEALHRGVRYLTVDAGAMSCPILERMGFARLTGAQGYVWEPVAGA